MLIKSTANKFRQKELSGVVVHRAGWVVASPRHIYENGFIVAEEERILDVGSGSHPSADHVIDHGGGMLLPALVNAHTHLELCALNGKIESDQGFSAWILQLLAARLVAGEDNLLHGARAGIRQLKTSGCCAVGEISSLGLTLATLRRSGLGGVWFREYLGNDIKPEGDLKAGHPMVSAAGHAPHTTHPVLLKRLKQATQDRHLPFSLHLAESKEEFVFLTTAKGNWAELLTSRGIDYSDWGLPARSPVAYVSQLNLLDASTVATHVLHADKQDLDLLAAGGGSICICPRSNLTLHGRIPDLKTMLHKNIPVCLGTDSLASVSSLSMWDEMAFVAKSYRDLDPADIWAMATINGARALGITDSYGELAPGKACRLIYLDILVSSRERLMETLVHAAETGLVEKCLHVYQ